ncbi:MAG TPA: hypothetical protein VER05_04700, partial [Cellulomonas sp.]|nr:hypothetical protein [Cellulomonas sp.]
MTAQTHEHARAGAAWPGAAAEPAAGRTARPAPPAPSLLDRVVEEAVALDCSDIHLAAEHPPLLRVHGELRAAESVPRLTEADVRAVVAGIASADQLARFDADHELDFAHEV